MLLAHNISIFRGLTTTPIYYFTAKSRRQTTPHMFQNPRLTPHGIVKKASKSYAYNLPETLHNRHLYWNNTEMNRLYRREYKKRKLQKLKINPIHDKNGRRTFDRQLPEILSEVSRVSLVKASLNRTIANLTQVAIRFKATMSEQDKLIVAIAIDDLHDRFLPSMSGYQFTSYIQIRCLMQKKCTQNIFIHFYKFIQKFSEMSRISAQEDEYISSNEKQYSFSYYSSPKPVLKQTQPIRKFKFDVFLKICKYVFDPRNAKFIKANIHLLYKSRELFKLFEDNDPRYISLEELMPYTYSKTEVEPFLEKPDVKQNLKVLLRIPGGQQLYKNIVPENESKKLFSK